MIKFISARAMEEDEFGEPYVLQYPPFWEREKEKEQIALARMMITK